MSAETMLELVIRSPKMSDQAYVASTWTQSLLTADRKLTKSDVNTTIDRVLDDPEARVILACEPTRYDVIIGWLCYTLTPTSRVIHYVYVRDKMRRRGVASQLYRKAFPRDAGKLVYTFRGPDSSALLKVWPYAVHLPIQEFLSP